MTQIIATEIPSYQEALNALNAYRSSEWKDGRPVYEVILEHNDAVRAIQELPEEEQLEYVDKMAQKYGDLIVKDRELYAEYQKLYQAYILAKKPERQKPDEVEKKYFPIAVDEYDYYSKKDDGTVQIGAEGEKPEG